MAKKAYTHADLLKQKSTTDDLSVEQKSEAIAGVFAPCAQMGCPVLATSSTTTHTVQVVRKAKKVVKPVVRSLFRSAPKPALPSFGKPAAAAFQVSILDDERKKLSEVREMFAQESMKRIAAIQRRSPSPAQEEDTSPVEVAVSNLTQQDGTSSLAEGIVAQQLSFGADGSTQLSSLPEEVHEEVECAPADVHVAAIPTVRRAQNLISRSDIKKKKTVKSSKKTSSSSDVTPSATEPRPKKTGWDAVPSAPVVDTDLAMLVLDDPSKECITRADKKRREQERMEGENKYKGHRIVVHTVHRYIRKLNKMNAAAATSAVPAVPATKGVSHDMSSDSSMLTDTSQTSTGSGAAPTTMTFTVQGSNEAVPRSKLSLDAPEFKPRVPIQVDQNESNEQWAMRWMHKALGCPEYMDNLYTLSHSNIQTAMELASAGKRKNRLSKKKAAAAAARAASPSANVTGVPKRRQQRTATPSTTSVTPATKPAATATVVTNAVKIPATTAPTTVVEHTAPVVDPVTVQSPEEDQRTYNGKRGCARGRRGRGRRHRAATEAETAEEGEAGGSKNVEEEGEDAPKKLTKGQLRRQRRHRQANNNKLVKELMEDQSSTASGELQQPTQHNSNSANSSNISSVQDKSSSTIDLTMVAKIAAEQCDGSGNSSKMSASAASRREKEVMRLLGKLLHEDTVTGEKKLPTGVPTAILELIQHQKKVRESMADADATAAEVSSASWSDEGEQDCSNKTTATAITAASPAAPSGKENVMELVKSRLQGGSVPVVVEESLTKVSIRLHQRERQLKLAERTVGYKVWSKCVASGEPNMLPLTMRPPNPLQACSKRSWQGQLRRWRRMLHTCDALAADVLTAEEEVAPKRKHRVIQGQTMIHTS